MNPIAKYRKPGHPNEWYLTDFTMSQVEGRLEYLEQEIERLRGELAKHERYLAHLDQEETETARKLTRYEEALNAIGQELRAYAEYLREVDAPYGQIEDMEELASRASPRDDSVKKSFREELKKIKTTLAGEE